MTKSIVPMPAQALTVEYAMQCRLEDNDPPGVAGRCRLSVWRDRHEGV